MKKIITFTLGLVLISGSFSSCKKGDNDPFLSLRSRKARLEGSWKVTKEEVTETNTDGTTTVQIQSIFDGSKKITTTTTKIGAITSVDIDTVKYVVTLVIDKKGNYNMTNVNDNHLDVYTEKGTWIFLGKSNLDKLKNKEAILLTTTQTIISDGNETNTVDYTNLSGKTIVLDALKNKEMITIVEENSANSTGLDSSKKLTKTTYTQN